MYVITPEKSRIIEENTHTTFKHVHVSYSMDEESVDDFLTGRGCDGRRGTSEI